MHWVSLLGAVAAGVVGQGMLKAGVGTGSFVAQVLNWRTLLGLGIYGGSAFLYIGALRRIPLSVALPCTALSYVFVALIGHFMFQEPLGAQRLLGLGLIGLGVVALAAS